MFYTRGPSSRDAAVTKHRFKWPRNLHIKSQGFLGANLYGEWTLSISYRPKPWRDLVGLRLENCHQVGTFNSNTRKLSMYIILEAYVKYPASAFLQ